MRNHLYALGFILGFLCGNTQAATVINFDDIRGSTPDCGGWILPNNAACIRLPGNYNGFTWDNGWAINGCVYNSGSGYCRSTASPPNTLFNGYSSPMTISKSDRSQFNFFGASIGIAWSPGWINFSGRRNGTTVYSTTFSATLDPTFLTLRYYNIDQLYITSANQMVMDNFSLSGSLCQTPGLTYNVTSPALLGNQIYYAYADFNTCFGTLIATSIDRTTGAYSNTANWEAGCTLSGPGTPPTTQVPSGPKAPCSAVPNSLQPTAAQGLVNRTMASYSPPIDKINNLFTDGTNVLPTQSSFINTVNSVYPPIKVLRYLAGNTNLEGSDTSVPGLYRPRTSQLGDIVNSSPVVVGPATGSYDTMQTDLLNQSSLSTEASSYATYKQSTATRPNMVYIGANDGFVHAFRGGTQDSNGVTVGNGGTPNDGREMLAFAPSNALMTIASTRSDLNYSNQNYDHNYFVDATPGVGDLYLNGSWQTWLVGGLGAGGNASGPVSNDASSAAGLLYTINVTDPSNFTRTGVTTRQNVRQELNSGNAGVAGTSNNASILCTNTPLQNGDPGPCAQNMGAIYGTPVIRRMHNGKWDILFGNGLYSQSGKAGIFTLNSVDNLLLGDNYWSDARAPAIAGQKNGIVHITPVDLDGDQVIDYVYAGDVQGNIWRFDVTANDESVWPIVPPVKIFSTPNGQPITTKLVVTTMPLGSGKAVLVEFGTGRAWPLLNSFGNNYATGVQSLYGIMDTNFDKWNRKSGTQYASQTSLPSNSTLVTQTITGTTTINGVKYRTVAANPVCWIGASGIQGCQNYNNYGWKIDLPGIGNAGFREQVVFDPQIVNNVLVVNTLTPGWPLDTSEGYTMTVTNNGGAPASSFFSGANGASNVIGANLNGLGTAVFLPTTNAKLEMYQKNANQQPTVTDIASNTARTVKQMTWSRLR